MHLVMHFVEWEVTQGKNTYILKANGVIIMLMWCARNLKEKD